MGGPFSKGDGARRDVLADPDMTHDDKGAERVAVSHFMGVRS